MLDVVFCQPEIPSGTGGIIRLCANTEATLHLIRPFGFSLEKKQLRRASLIFGPKPMDYRLISSDLHRETDICMPADATKQPQPEFLRHRLQRRSMKPAPVAPHLDCQ